MGLKVVKIFKTSVLYLVLKLHKHSNLTQPNSKDSPVNNEFRQTKAVSIGQQKLQPANGYTKLLKDKGLILQEEVVHVESRTVCDSWLTSQSNMGY